MGMSEPLRLPEGYRIEATDDNDLLLKRPDGSSVFIFEFSVFGPDPRRVWEIAWKDADRVQQDADRREHGYRQAEQRSLVLISEGLDLGTGGKIFVSREELHERGL